VAYAQPKERARPSAVDGIIAAVEIAFSITLIVLAFHFTVVARAKAISVEWPAKPRLIVVQIYEVGIGIDRIQY
jgi:hypothetical protein